MRLTPAPATTVAGKVMIGHNFWTDRAREPVKTSLDAGDSNESKELDKYIPLHLKVLQKNNIYVFAMLNFCQFSVKILQLVPRIRF